MKSNDSACISSDVLLSRKSNRTTIYFLVFVYLYIFTAFVSTILNSLIISTLILARELHGIFYKILGSLFISDLITGALIFPMLATLNATYAKPDCILLTLCQLSVNIISLASILSMLAIAYDRFLRASKRHAYNLSMKKTKGYIIIIAIWITSPIIGALNTFVYKKLIAMCALLVIGMILAFYITTLKKLKTSRNRISDNLSKCPNASCPTNGLRRSSRLVFALIFAMLLCWSPSIAISMISSEVLYSTNQYFLSAVQQLPLLSAVTSPFLYFWTNRTTRQCFIVFCQKLFCRRGQNHQNNVIAFSN